MEVLLKGVKSLGLDLRRRQVVQFQLYLRELAEWNKRVNLTSLVGSLEVQAKHFLDSLTVSIAIPEEVRSGGRLADIGSGAGFPGLPLKILLPEMRVTLIESVGKKVAFLRHIVDTMELEGLEVYNGRAESLAHEPSLRETFDVVVSRGVAGLRVLTELTVPFCKVGGRVIAQKKTDIAAEVKKAERALSILGGVLERIEVVDLEEIGEPRSLVVITKVASSPSHYPRRPGLPAKRPL